MKFDKLLTPFFELFTYIASRMYGGTEAVQLTKFKQDKPAYFVAAIIADMAIRLLVVVLAVYLVVNIALKLVS